MLGRLLGILNGIRDLGESEGPRRGADSYRLVGVMGF
jgi:hypothetical protein